MTRKRKNKSKQATGQNKPTQPAPSMRDPMVPLTDSKEQNDAENIGKQSATPDHGPCRQEGKASATPVEEKATTPSSKDADSKEPASKTSHSPSCTELTSALESSDICFKSPDRTVVTTPPKTSTAPPDENTIAVSMISEETTGSGSRHSSDSDDGFVQVTHMDASSPTQREGPTTEEEASKSPAKPPEEVTVGPVGVATEGLADVLARRTSVDHSAGSAQLSDKLKPTMHILETDMKRQAVKAVLTPTLCSMQQEISGEGSGSPQSAAQKQKREATGVVGGSHMAPVIAAAASSVKTKIAGQELVKKVRRRPSTEELLLKGILVNTDDASVESRTNDGDIAADSASSAPSAPSVNAKYSPAQTALLSNSSDSQRRRPSFTDTEEYSWLESLPRAKAVSPLAPPTAAAPPRCADTPVYVPYRAVERRVIVAVTLKVLAELKNRQILDADVVGTIKEKLFEDDPDIVRAVEEFVLSKNLELLIEAIYNVAGHSF